MTKAPLIFHGYAWLFCLTVIAINPFVSTRGSIWTQPKIACVACVVAVHLFLLFRERQSVKLSNQWWIQAVGWLALLVSGLISSLLSSFPNRSLFGHSIAADGWLYWLLIAGFVLTNSLVLERYPYLLRWQIRGILVGATLVALSIYPQLVDWKVDYTVHSGQLWSGTNHVLATGIYQNQQPIGLYSHRGYASFTLSIASVLSLVALKNSWLPARIALPLTVLYTVTLSLARVRGALLAMLMGWLWIAWTAPQRRSTQRLLITLSLIGVLSFGWTTVERRVGFSDIYARTPIEAALKHFTSDRTYLWWTAWNRITERPWFGWGFSGYSIADANHLCPKGTKPTALEDYYVYCRTSAGETVQIPTRSIYAHNLLLDKYISLGAIGGSIYLALVCFCTLNVYKTNPPLLALVITYFVYLLTWFDCGQFSHLGWWVFTIQTSLSQKSN